METVRLYLKQELADCVYQREIGMNTDRGYERGIKVAYEVFQTFNGMRRDNIRIGYLQQLGKTPENAKKTILGGRLKGFTDINPMFRIKALTSEFGPIGKGWYIEVDRQWELQGRVTKSCAL